MTSQWLAEDIENEEGRRSDAYPDPVSGGDPWTIGVGHTGPEVHEGLVWSDDQITAARDSDASKAAQGIVLSGVVGPVFGKIDALRQDSLVQMAFQMGVAGLEGFPKMLAALEAGDYATAASEGLDSLWARQTPKRARRVMWQIKNGQRAWETAQQAQAIGDGTIPV